MQTDRRIVESTRTVAPTAKLVAEVNLAPGFFLQEWPIPNRDFDACGSLASLCRRGNSSQVTEYCTLQEMLHQERGRKRLVLSFAGTQPSRT